MDPDTLERRLNDANHLLRRIVEERWITYCRSNRPFLDEIGEHLHACKADDQTGGEIG